MARRVVITGVGMVSPLGCGRGSSIYQRVVENCCGVGPIQDLVLPAQCNVHVVGAVPKGEAPGEYNDAQHKNKTETSLFIRYALTAAQFALEDAQLADGLAPFYDRTRCGAAIGNGGIGSITEITQTHSTLQQSYRKVSPYFVPKILVNMAAGHVSLRHGLQGPVHSVATACAAGLHSIGDAYNFIRFGMADAMLAGGSDGSIDALSITGFNRMKALCNDQGPTASKPFDRRRSGFVMGEGASVMVLEAYESALQRGAPIIAEVAGYGLSGDAHHTTCPSPEGHGAMLSMAQALRGAGITINQVDYVNAHATSTPVGDAVEITAISTLLRQAGSDHRPYVSSTKGHTGHLLGAAGALELGFAAMALKGSVLPATLNLQDLDPTCTSDQVQHIMQGPVDFKAKHGREIKYVLKNSFGFGGTNASIVLKRFEG